MRTCRLFLFFVLIASVAATALADIKLPAVIGDNMVLQGDEPAPIWGWVDPGTEVHVVFDGKTVKAKADKDGRFQVELGPLQACKKPANLVIETTAGDRKELGNILVGDVWVCSGQSNMDFRVISAVNAKKEIAEANYPEIRIFKVARTVADTPRKDCNVAKDGKKGEWDICSPKTVVYKTAVGYFFARELNRVLDKPIGIIQTSWGGTPSEAWTSRKALEAKPELKPLLDRWDKAAKSPKAAASPHRPANLYNAMIAPLLPFAVKGAIWYQGESNVGRAVQYRTVFPTMIENWRDVWNKPGLPFGFVQIAPYKYNRQANPGRNVEKCAELWEAQVMTMQKLDNVGMAVTTDIGNLLDIHPKNKQDVGRRLALWAQAQVYGDDDLAYSGPIYKSMKKEGNKIRLTFDHAEGLKTSDGKELNEFTIAGADEKFAPAKATIDGETIVVESDAVADPVAVRFGWHELAQPNLVNGADLPASPFRTDNFKALTEGAH